MAERPAEAARLLRAALSLYRGDLLEGVPTLPALEIERERLRRLYAKAHLARVDADLALGRHLLVVEELVDVAADDCTTRRSWPVSSFPSTAQVHRSRPSRCTANSRDACTDLGLAPCARVQALQRQILRHDESLALAPRSSAAWRAPLERPVDQLVGRETLLLRLESELGGDRVHTLVGPSGVGKTRIATELAARCQATYPDGAVLVALEGVCGTDGSSAGWQTPCSRPRRGALRPIEAARVAARARALVSSTTSSRRRTSGAGSTTWSRRAGPRSWSPPHVRRTAGRADLVGACADEDAAAELLLVRARHAGADLPTTRSHGGRRSSARAWSTGSRSPSSSSRPGGVRSG